MCCYRDVDKMLKDFKGDSTPSYAKDSHQSNANDLVSGDQKWIK